MLCCRMIGWLKSVSRRAGSNVPVWVHFVAHLMYTPKQLRRYER